MFEPSINYTCPHCGHHETYRLVPAVAPDPAARVAQAITSIDLRCLRCDTNQTYKLVPKGVDVASTGR